MHCHKFSKLIMSFSHSFYSWSWDSMLLTHPMLASGARFSRKIGNIIMFTAPLNFQNSFIFVFLPYYSLIKGVTCQSKQNTTTAPHWGCRQNLGRDKQRCAVKWLLWEKFLLKFVFSECTFTCVFICFFICQSTSFILLFFSAEYFSRF